MLEQKSFIKTALLYFSAILLTITNLSDVKIGGFTDVMPLLDLMAVFYFTIYKNKFGLAFIFLLGVWGDALSGNILGLTSLCYIILIKLFAFFNNRILAKENFMQIWQQFAVFIVLFLLLKWLLLFLINGKASAVSILLVQIIISTFFYVPMHVFFDFLSKKLFEE